MRNSNSAAHPAPAIRKTRVSRAASTAIDATGEGVKKSMRGAILQPLEAASLPDALLKIQTVAAVTGLSASTIFRKVAADPPQFPAPVRLGKRCTRWHSSSVRGWLAAQVAG